MWAYCRDRTPGAPPPVNKYTPMRLDGATLFRNQSITFKRPATSDSGGLDVEGEPTDIGPVACRAIDDTSEVQRSPTGANVEYAFTLITNDTATVIKPKDVAPISIQGGTVYCEVKRATIFNYTQQIRCEKRVG